MQIYLIRHTTPKVGKGICYGQTDISLDQTNFIQEYNIIKSKLPKDIEQYYTSPLQRCKILTEKLNQNFIVDERLMELNFGDWENKDWNEIDQSLLNYWMQDFVNIKTPNGENYLDLHKRTLHFINEILELNLNKIAIITHAGNIRSFVSSVLSLPLALSFRIHLNYGTVVSIQFEKLECNNKLFSIT
jgi:alpha-ribazole phosphatase